MSAHHPKHAIVIDGPRRDYDFALFCCHHVNAANDFAAEWLAELIDEMDPGEDASVKVSIKLWQEGVDECSECELAGVVATEHVLAERPSATEKP